MGVPRVLIAGTCYLNSPEKVELLRIWDSLIQRHSSNCDVLIIDSCSPIAVKSILPVKGRRHVFRFDTDIGHPRLSSDPSRDFLYGLEYAVAQGYEYVVHWETDCLFARPVMDVFRRMWKSRVNVACPFEANQQFVETQLLFFSVAYLKWTKFIEKYRAQHDPKRDLLSELLVEKLCGDDLFLLPLRGMRNNFHTLLPSNIRAAFRNGCDWLSHCDDFSVYVEFLRMNGVYS